MKRPAKMTALDEDLAKIGRMLDRKSYLKSKQERSLLEWETKQLSDRLEEQGIETKEGTSTIIGLVTENYTDAQDYKNINMLPIVQARNTHDLMQNVSFWMDTTSSKYQRMWVVDMGWIPLYQYRDHHQALTRAISKFHKCKFLQEAGIEFVYYAVENTIHRADPKDENNTDIRSDCLLHLHAHILVKSTKRLGSARWKRMLERAKAWWPTKDYLNDGPIKKAAEVVKYVFKPQEFDELKGYELGELYRQCKGLRFHIPLGELRDFRRGIKEDSLKLRKIDLDDGPVWRLVEKTSRKIEKNKNISAPPDNVVVAITSASPRFSELYEPCIIVKRFDGNMAKLLAMNPWLEQRIDGIRRTAARRQALSALSMEHTTTTTVQKNSTDWWQSGDHHPPPI